MSIIEFTWEELVVPHGWRIARFVIGLLPRGAVVKILREALIVTKYPVIANINVKSFDGTAINNMEISLVDCVQTEVYDHSSSASHFRNNGSSVFRTSTRKRAVIFRSNLV